ncbi:Uncharacterised protein [Burkholderia pseudomallei]|nr:Uncharacterised protein [Burkholderia pseudomallei]
MGQLALRHKSEKIWMSALYLKLFQSCNTFYLNGFKGFFFLSFD